MGNTLRGEYPLSLDSPIDIGRSRVAVELMRAEGGTKRLAPFIAKAARDANQSLVLAVY